MISFFQSLGQILDCDVVFKVLTFGIDLIGREYTLPSAQKRVQCSRNLL